MSALNGKTAVGWREFVSLPCWGVDRIRAKVDTGARSSALDVRRIHEAGDERVVFDLVVSRKPLRTITCEADIVRRAHVKSSSGDGRDRIFVRTRMRLGEVEKEIEVGLVCRKHMICRMLIGRRALRPEFVVDTEHRYLASSRRAKRVPDP